MISTYHMREIQKDNQRNINRANEIKRYYYQDGDSKPARQGIVPRFLNNAGSILVKVGIRLQGFSAYRQSEI